MRNPLASVAEIALLAGSILGTSLNTWGDTFYVGTTQGNASTIAVFDSNGNGSIFASYITIANHILRDPLGLAFDGNGYLYAAYSTDNKILKFDPSGNWSVFADSGLNAPQGLAFDTSGNLYVANRGNNTIEKFDRAGNGSVFAHVFAPDGLAFDRNGNLYSTVAYGQLERFDASGHGSTFATGFASPSGLAFDSSGNLYVSDAYNGYIFKLDPSGTIVKTIRGANAVDGLAFDSSGYLCAVIPNGIEKFDSNGNGSVFASSGLLYHGVSIAVWIPEPASSGLLALSGGLFIASRRLGRHQPYPLT